MSGAVLDTESMTGGPTPDELRLMLQHAQRQKAQAERDREKAVESQRSLLKLVAATPGVTMTEAAQILKISRRMAHGMVNSA